MSTCIRRLQVLGIDINNRAYGYAHIPTTTKDLKILS